MSENFVVIEYLLEDGLRGHECHAISSLVSDDGLLFTLSANGENGEVFIGQDRVISNQCRRIQWIGFKVYHCGTLVLEHHHGQREDATSD